MKTSIIKKTGQRPGPTVAIFAGVHGNELDCVKALDFLVANTEIERGEVYFVYANPEAIGRQQRFIEKNLNRCFFSGNQGNTKEDRRARQLMQILDKCEALLDLHQYNDPAGQPFVICESNSLSIVENFDIELISTGWGKVEPGGTDYYMYMKNKPGICAECGPQGRPEEVFDTAVETARRFMKYFNIIPGPLVVNRQQQFMEMRYVAIRKSNDFKFLRTLRSFEALMEGEKFAIDGKINYVAEVGDIILFPRPNAPIGTEAFLIGKIKNKTKGVKNEYKSNIL